ncbi:MAG: hypothetical protein COT85_05335 [Chlamydiae bacterium CG10_big_fil_rev_8_21_14_0_10_42_34]|nr:MAG: hypothetical protein COT85_05335 [Chlamydiae bacterium CG10_big_fil_rev_8_21_14_0_10_42_34]
MNVSVTPIAPLRDRNSEEGRFQAKSSPVDSKVRGVVLELMCNAKGGLFASASAPQIVIDVLPTFDSSQLGYTPKEKRKSKLKKAPINRKAPIGLKSVDREGWLNSLMQFILFVPGFAELFFFAPRSFYPFQGFIDQYYLDQQENRAISRVNGLMLFRFLNLKLSSLSLCHVFEFLSSHLHPQWKISATLDDALATPGAKDLFVIAPTSRRQFFTEENAFFYDLDAFIELRPDGQELSFITYVKVDGSWYQCDDDRITQLTSNYLSVPLSRSVLLHYRRVELGKKW